MNPQVFYEKILKYNNEIRALYRVGHEYMTVSSGVQ